MYHVVRDTCTDASKSTVACVYCREELLPAVMEFAKELAINVPVTSLAVIKQQVLHHPHMVRNDALHDSNSLMAISTRGSPE